MPRIRDLMPYIGKVVYRINNTCPCPTCTEVYNKGLCVRDAGHANYLNDYIDETGIPFFDNKEERDEHERMLIV